MFSVIIVSVIKKATLNERRTHSIMVIKNMIKKSSLNTPTPLEDTTPKTTTKSARTIEPMTPTHEGDSMKDLFFIVKGQYRKGVEPCFVNRATGEVSWIGGHDPSKDTTEEWYMLMDKMTFHCVGCGSDLNKVLHGIHTQIMKHKGSAKKYFKWVSSVTSDDYYEVRYLGHQPLDHDKRVKKAEGRCPRVSPPMRCLYEAIYSEYGDYYLEQIEEMEDLAYHDLKVWQENNKPLNKTRNRMKKTPLKKVEVEEKTPPKERTTPLNIGKIKRPKMGVKRPV